MGIFDETAENLAKGAVKSAAPVDKKEKPNALKDIALAVPRGIEGFAQSIYNLGDAVVGDALPDYNERFLGRSETMVGGFVEGATQFMTGFVPIMGAMGKAGKIATLSNKTKGAAGLLAKGQNHLKPEMLGAISKLKPKQRLALQTIGASAATDFLAFDAQEERLADLIQQFPALQNPVAEFLQADDTDGQIEGRLKNVLEGLFIEAGIGAIAVPFLKGIKLIKNRNKKMANGMDKTEATESSLKETDLTEDEVTYNYITREEARMDRAEEDALIDEMGGDYESPFSREGRKPENTDFREEANVSADTPVDENGVVLPPEERELPEMPIDSTKPMRLNPDDDPNPFVDPSDKPSALEQNAEFNQARAQREADETKTPTTEEVDGEIRRENDLYNEVRKVVTKVLDDADTINGGSQAIKSAYRGFRTTSERAVFAKALAEERLARQKKAGTIPETNAEELTTVSTERMDIMGQGEPNKVAAHLARLKKGENSTAKLAEFREEQNVLFEVQEFAAENVTDAARAFRLAKENDAKFDSGGVEKARTELFIALEQLTEAQQLWAEYGREFSLGLLARKFLYKKGHKRLGGRDAIKDKRQGFDFDNPEMATKEAMEEYRDRMRGSMNEDKMINILIAARDGTDLKQQVEAMAKLNAKQRVSRGFDMAKEYWINSLLSGPSTQLVNVMGNSLTMAIRNAEVVVGAAMRGDMSIVRANLDFSYYMESIQEAWALTKKTMIKNEAQTIPDRRAFLETNFDRRAITAKNAGLDDDSTLGRAVNWMGNFVGLPSRFLLSGDEFFKALNYRHYVRTDLAVKGYDKGLRGKELADYVETRHQASITKQGAMYNEDSLYREAQRAADETVSKKYGTKGLQHTERRAFVDKYMEDNRTKMEGFNETQREDLLERAKTATLVNTHTQDAKFGSLKEITKIVNDNPLLTFVVPFIRTPANILKFGLGRTGIKLADVKGYKQMGELRASELKAKELNQVFEMGDRRKIAEMNGQLSTAATMTSLALWYAYTNKDFISGYGPRDPEERELWKNAGNQEYSIKVGNTNYSYQRLDPFATMLGVYADLIEGSNSGELDGDKASNVFALLALTFQNNITNKSYVQGIDNLFQVMRDPMKNGKRFVGNIAAGFVPNVLNQGMNYQEGRLLRETRGTLDYLLKRTPVLNQRLMPKRNLFGEAMTMPSSGLDGVLNPIYRKEISTDLVDHEFANLGHGFSKPTDKLFGEINMHDFTNEDGQTAYDRMLELSGTTKINGQTQKEALRKLIQQPTYQAMPMGDDDDTGTKSPRVKAIQRIQKAYRRKAKSQTLQEFDELRNAYSTHLVNKKQYLN
tara:strand:- start:319 stop:4305 length:3987 start_codon:yes stop_codon:yes gene_type:complete